MGTILFPDISTFLNSAQFAFISAWPEILWNWPFDEIFFFFPLEYPHAVLTNWYWQSVAGMSLASGRHTGVFFFFFLFAWHSERAASLTRINSEIRFWHFSPLALWWRGGAVWTVDFNNKTVAPRTGATLLPATHTCRATPTWQHILKDRVLKPRHRGSCKV